MNKRYIPVCWRSWRTRYYLTHPWKFFKDIWVAWTNFYTRARKGYAWIDLWNFDNYLMTMIPNAIEELAEKSAGAPFGDFEGSRWIEFEDWQNELYVLASLMKIAQMDAVCEEEEFEAAYDKWCSGEILKPIEGLSFYNEYVYPENADERLASMNGKYLRLHEKREILMDVIFMRLRGVWNSFWD